MVDLNNLALVAKENAFKRGKTLPLVLHSRSAADILKELTEFLEASETKASEHIPDYTEAQEELTDILITCLTELAKRNVDIEKTLMDKIFYNQTRST